jgi:hypothetical protein
LTSLKCIAPRLGVHLDNWIAIVCNNVSCMLSIELVQNRHGGLINGTAWIPIQADMTPLNLLHVGLP